MTKSRFLAYGLATTLVAGLVIGLPSAAHAAPEPTWPAENSVDVSPLVAEAKAKLPAMGSFTPSAVSWPTAASRELDVPSAALRFSAPPVSVGGLPVRVVPVVSTDEVTGRGEVVEPAPARVRVEVLDRATSSQAAAPVAVRLSRADGGVGAAKVHFELDASSFRDAFGAAYMSRVELQLAPACALETIDEALARQGACATVALDSVADFRTGLVAADVDLNTVFLEPSPLGSLSPKQHAIAGTEGLSGVQPASGGDVIVMLTTGSDAQGVGTFGKTDLKESGTWSHSGASGNFAYDYPMQTPPVPGGLQPDLGLNYSSASVDGQTASEHMQNGPIGEGWSIGGTGFIEATFRPCKLDQDHSPTWTTTTVQDPCWRHENYQLALSGRSGEMIHTPTPNVWRVAADDASRLEFVPSSLGGHWKMSTPDGMQYFFGLQRLPGWAAGGRETASVLQQETFANHSGEPCFSSSSYAASHCRRPYRWLLDFVVDANGNSMSYWYTRFTNLAGSNYSGSPTYSYDRDAVLDRIEYGTRWGNEANTTNPPAKVEFTNSLRCLASCGTEASPTTANWIDVPWDKNCTASPCNSNKFPSYWTTRRVTKIATKVWTGSGSTYKTVDEWNLTQSFPDDGGSIDVPTLWLDTITRTGYDTTGASQTLPSLSLHGIVGPNRADYDPGASMANPMKYRLDHLFTETGGDIEVTYQPVNEPGDACTWWSGKPESAWPNYNHNNGHCFQQYITNRSGNEGWSMWHKYLVDKITERDLVGGSPDVTTSYQYLWDGATSNHPLVLWGYTSSWWASPNKAMSAWKGYPTVITTTGAIGQTQSKVKRLYYRGLDRDTGLNTGQEFFRTSQVVDSQGTSVLDHPALGGMVREETVYDGASGPELSKTIATHSVIATSAGGTLPTWQTPPERYAYLTGETSNKTMTKVAGGSWRTAETQASFDATFGTITQVNDLGQTVPALSTDDTCTRYTYSRNVEDLVRRDGTGGGLVGAAAWRITADMAGYDHLLTPGDFTGDGKPDLLARKTSDFTLHLFTGTTGGGFTGPTVVGTGWTSDIDMIFSPGDFNGDSKPDVIYRRVSDGNLYMVRGNGTGGWITGSSEQIGSGWAGAQQLFSTGDFDADAKTDVFYYTSAGELRLYRGNGTGGFQAGYATVSSTLTGKNWLFGKGDVTGDGKHDLYTRDNTGAIQLYPGTGTTATLGAPIAAPGDAWHTYQQLVAVGDITGDAKPDLVGRSNIRLTSTATRMETVGVDCGTTASYPADLVADTVTSYDGSSSTTTSPIRGLVSAVDVVSAHSGVSPTYVAQSQAGYDTYGRTTFNLDALGRQTDHSYTHNSAGLLTSSKATLPEASVGASRHETTTVLDPLRGSALTVTDPNGKVTTAGYDPLGRLTSVKRAGNTTALPDAEYLYSITKTTPSYIRTKTLMPNGNQDIQYEILDGHLRMRQAQSTAPDGKRVIKDTQYDGRGLTAKTSTFYNSASAPTSTLVSFADTAVDQQQRFTYDGVQRPLTEEVWKQNTFQHKSSTVYEGDRVGVIPPIGGTVTQELVDVRGQMVEKRQYHSPTALTGTFDATIYGYDDAGQLTTVKDPANNTWTYRYNLLGHKYETIDPDAGTLTSTFDNAGQVLSTTDARGQQLYFEYDNLYRKSVVRGDSVGGPIQASWTYDTVDKGQLTSSSRFVGATTYTTSVGSYDDAYRPESITQSIPGFGASGGTLTYTVTNTYKPSGAKNTTTMPAVADLPAETLTYGYNDQGLTKTLTAGAISYITDTTWHYDGQIYRQFYGTPGQQARLTREYDAATRRLYRIWASTEKPSEPGVFNAWYSTTYSYDPAGNVTSIAGANAGIADQEECFTYDYLQRLTEAWTQLSGACTTPQRTGADPYWRKWTFDSLGNRLTQVDRNTGTGDTTWTSQVGAAGGVKPHQVKQVTSTGPLAGPTRTFGYDLAGNSSTATSEAGAAQTLTWDKEGHLGSIAQGTNNYSYTYDADGQRIIAIEPGKSTAYLLDGTELALVGTVRTGTRHVAGIAVRSVAATRWIIADAHGSSTVQIAAVVLSLHRRRFMPYGEPRGSQPTWIGTKGYVDGTKDPTGFTHLGAREYDPSLGRFASIDPLFDTGDPQSWHGYLYGNNSPLTFSDPTGLSNWFTTGLKAVRDGLYDSTVGAVVSTAKTVVTETAQGFGRLNAVTSGEMTYMEAMSDTWNNSMQNAPHPLTGLEMTVGLVAMGTNAQLSLAAGDVEGAAAGYGYLTGFAAGTYLGLKGASALRLRRASAQPMGGNGVVLSDGAGASFLERMLSRGGATSGRPITAAERRQLLGENTQADGTFRGRCWRCGLTSASPKDFHVGHRNRARSHGGNKSRWNICLEGMACNTSAQNRGRPRPGMSCYERGSCNPTRGRLRGNE